MASGRRWKQFSKFFGNIVHYSNKTYKRDTKEGWKEAICSRKPVFSFVFKEMFVSVHEVLPFLTILDLPWPLSWRLIGLHQCAGFPHCSQRLLNSNFGCHKCFIQMCQKCATTDSLTLKNPAQRDRADEERFSRFWRHLLLRYLRRFSVMPACSQATGTEWKSVLRHLSPSAFRLQLVAEGEEKRTTNTVNNKPVHSFWISRIQLKWSESNTASDSGCSLSYLWECWL